jgi:hypothetical protein
MLLLNGIAVAYFTILFRIHQAGTQRLPSPDKFAQVENVLRTQPAEKGRQNAIDLLHDVNKSLNTTLEIIGYGFCCVASLLTANVIISVICILNLRSIFQAQQRPGPES